jgi:hypothetical protein
MADDPKIRLPFPPAAEDSSPPGGSIEAVTVVQRIDIGERDAIMAKLKEQYLVSERTYWLRRNTTRYYLPDATKTLVFESKGRRVTTKLDSPEVVRSMVELAQAKGWLAIRINGSDSFKSKVWVQAQLAGLPTKGYKPDAYDREILKLRRDALMADFQSAQRSASPGTAPSSALSTPVSPTATTAATATYSPTTAPNVTPRPTPEPASTSTKQSPSRSAVALVKRLARAGMQADANASAAVADYLSELAGSPRIFVGALVDHGKAPFGFEANGKPSYFIKLQTSSGEKIVWGVDLPRAFAETAGAPPRVGDVVMLAARGAQTVDVVDPRTGQKTPTPRNTWYLETVQALPAVAARALIKPNYVQDPDPAIGRSATSATPSTPDSTSTSTWPSEPPNSPLRALAVATEQALASALRFKGASESLISALSAQVVAEVQSALPPLIAQAVSPSTPSTAYRSVNQQVHVQPLPSVHRAVSI